MYTPFSVVFGEQPSASKWNTLGTNDAYFNGLIQADGTAVKLLDSSGNEILRSTKVASATNEVTVTNAATGTSPSLAASGGDTNIGLILGGKGSLGTLADIPVITGAFSNPASGTEAVVATLTIPAQPVATYVFVVAASGWSLGGAAASYDGIMRLRLTNAAGAVQKTIRINKTTASGNEYATYPFTHLYSLAANTAATLVMTMACTGATPVLQDAADAYAFILAQ